MRFASSLLIVLASLLFLAAPAAAEITAEALASRAGGVAPLAVFFDATGTTHTDGGIDEFHDLLYEWSFDDPGAGTWTVSGEDKNAARGPLAAHVFDTAGTYTVTVVVTDASGDTDTDTVDGDIIVTDPDTVFSGGATICISNDTDHTGCPSGATEIDSQADSDIALATNCNVDAASVRCLFKAGDSFTSSVGVSLYSTGPGIVGSYGSGAKPTVTDTSGNVITFGSNTNDWRVMDLALTGPGTGAGINTAFEAEHSLIYNVDASNYTEGIRSSFDDAIYCNDHQPPDPLACTPPGPYGKNDAVFIVGGTMGFSEDYGILFAGSRGVIMGTTVEGTYHEHSVRVSWLVDGVISHNYFTGESVPAQVGYKTALKFHGYNMTAPPSQLGDGEETENWVISHNVFVGNSSDDETTIGSAVWPVVIGPQNASANEHVRHGIIEANHFIAGANTESNVHLFAADISFRNNIFDCDASTKTLCRGVEIGLWGVETQDPDDNRIMHNTFANYSNLSDLTDSMAIVIDSNAHDTIVQNNLRYAPTHTSVMVEDNGVDTMQCNGSACNVDAASNPFIQNPPVNPEDYELDPPQALLIDAGVAMSVLTDFLGVSRPQGSGFDIGAMELESGAGWVGVHLTGGHCP